MKYKSNLSIASETIFIQTELSPAVMVMVNLFDSVFKLET